MNCNVVLSGSGIRFPYFVGALKAIELFGYKIKAIAGTSGGAIIAGTYSYVLNASKLKEHILTLNLKDYVSYNWTFWKGYSAYKISEDLFKDKILSITNTDRIEKSLIPLKIVTTNISRSKIVIAQKGSLTDWIIASLSAPLIFRFKKMGKSYFVDGGLCKNLLADAWVDRKDEVTFLIHFSNKNTKSPKSFINYISNIVSTILSCNVSDEIEDVKRILDKNYIKIITLDSEVDAFDFNLTSYTDIEEMIASGFKQTILTLEEYSHSQIL